MGEEQVVAGMLAAMQARDWAAVAAALHPRFTIEYLHDGDRLTGREAYIAVNRDEPGEWRLVVEEIVAADDRVASRVRVDVTDPDGTAHVMHAGTFWTVRDGVIVDAVEFWLEGPPVDPSG